MLNDAYDFLLRGGFFMWPLAVFGAAIFGIGTTRLLQLLQWTWRPVSLTGDECHCGGAKEWAYKITRMARERKGLAGLDLVSSIEMALARLEDSLNRGVTTLRFLSQQSTLVGFIGTVSGMIKTFNVIAIKGTATPIELAGGIYEALFTTLLGLGIAIVGWIFAYTIEGASRWHIRHLESTVFALLESDPIEGKKPS